MILDKLNSYMSQWLSLTLQRGGARIAPFRVHGGYKAPLVPGGVISLRGDQSVISVIPAYRVNIVPKYSCTNVAPVENIN